MFTASKVQVPKHIGRCTKFCIFSAGLHLNFYHSCYFLFSLCLIRIFFVFIISLFDFVICFAVEHFSEEKGCINMIFSILHQDCWSLIFDANS